jgi:hypothetical protein
MARQTAKDLLERPVQLSVRMEEGLLDRLKKSAKHSLRSVSAEIAYRVRTSFDRDERAA